jgi:hypothetical protein
MNLLIKKLFAIDSLTKVVLYIQKVKITAGKSYLYLSNILCWLFLLGET